MANVVGVDVSAWQGEMDWNKARDKIQFAFIRAGIGNTSVDIRLAHNRAGCHFYDIPFGLYWFMKPDKDWRKHAQTFAATYLEDPGQLPPVMDVEQNGGLDKFALNNWLAKFVGYFETLTGKELTVYTSPGFWNGAMPMTNWAKNRRLWVAHWTGAEAPILPYEWTNINNPRTWSFWQWSADGNGQGAAYGAQSSAIDLDRYHGDVAAFNREFGTHITELPGTPPEPPTPPLTYPYQVFITAPVGLNIRNVPGGTDIGTLKNGSDVQVIGADGEWLHIAGGWIHSDYVKKA